MFIDVQMFLLCLRCVKLLSPRYINDWELPAIYSWDQAKQLQLKPVIASQSKILMNNSQKQYRIFEETLPRTALPHPATIQLVRVGKSVVDGRQIGRMVFWYGTGLAKRTKAMSLR